MHRLDFFDLLTRQPFRPFRIRCSLNITAEIRHPEMAILEYSTVRIESPSLPGSSAEEEIIVSLAHIVTVEYLASPDS
jgi:hypothetical protein